MPVGASSAGTAGGALFEELKGATAAALKAAMFTLQ